MSLFDDDDLSSSVSSCEKAIVDDGCKVKGKQDTADGLPGVGGVSGAKMVGVTGSRVEGVSRFTLTVDEKKRAEERWRTEVAASSLLRAAGTGGGQAGANPSQPGQSRFSASIAEALQLRKEATEELRMRRIQKQRQEEAKDEELVKKDREVGVFVTPEYMESLKRQNDPHRLSEKEELGGVNVEYSKKNKEEDHDDDDPLETYLKQLEEKRSTTTMHSTSSNNSAFVRNNAEHVEETVSMPGDQGESAMNSTNHTIKMDVNHDVTFNGKSSSSSLSFPTLTRGDEVGGKLPPHDGCRSDVNYHNNVAQSSEVASNPKNEARHEDALREAREMRKRRRADPPFIQAAIERFITRAMERLEAH
ncbi:hypothetical protein LSM04_002714 [Trypanosoma melophagium]|uniref:uncharacterized protein n=1 Tax=Trypanosoma melophagium TaxID=715481 RepID=UPI003519E012|nr:hypothetical protein LSM04_002714 [Trypanosoma melophagium]